MNENKKDNNSVLFISFYDCDIWNSAALEYLALFMVGLTSSPRVSFCSIGARRKLTTSTRLTYANSRPVSHK